MEELYAAVSFPTQKILSVFVNTTVSHILPKCKDLNNAFKNLNADTKSDDNKNDDEQNMELFGLCKDQLKKCVCLFADLLTKEIRNRCVLEESRYWLFDRMSWCLDKVEQIKSNMGIQEMPSKPTLTKSTMNLNLFIKDDFISWIDDAINMLDEMEKLFTDDFSNLLIRKQNTFKTNQWIKECITGLLGFRKILRELIFSAMSICQNCLVPDQRIINARCHVVLREAKSLMSEIVVDSKLVLSECDEIEFSSLEIKENLHFSTVKLFINILKEAINTLEACINRSVLALVLTCLSDPLKPMQKVIFSSTKDSDDEEKKSLTKDFDMHSEQIMQIGLFAISCSADKRRVLELKSCLASLEILDVHLIPTILSNPNSLHAQFLTEHWTHEMNILRNCVFLIVDPIAFIELVVELYQEKFNEMKSESPLKWLSAQTLIELGRCVLDYFNIYFDYEPNLFQQIDNLQTVIGNVNKAVKECKVVSDLFLMKPNEGNENITEGVKKPLTDKNQEQRVLKRFKLLYCLFMKIVKGLVNETQTLDDEDERETQIQNTIVKHNLEKNNTKTAHTSEAKRKGIFKIFDKFNIPTRNINKTLHKVTPEDINNINACKNNFSRTTIIRSKRTKSCIRTGDTLSCSVSYHDIEDRLKISKNDKFNDSLKDFISASGILDGVDDFILTDVSKYTERKHSILTKNTDIFSNHHNESTKHRNSVFYNNSKGFKNRQVSLRRKVLMNQMCSTGKKVVNPIMKSDDIVLNNSRMDKTVELFDESLNLHITEILESLDKVSDTISLMRLDSSNDEKMSDPVSSVWLNAAKEDGTQNVLRLKINESNNVSPKKVWNIKVSHDKLNVDDSVPERVKNVRAMTDKENICESHDLEQKKPQMTNSFDNINCEIDVSFGSDIPTSERLKDIQQLEMKVEYLKNFWRK